MLDNGRRDAARGEGATILKMPGNDQPSPSGYSRLEENGIAVDVRTWAECPEPACRRCEVCNVARLQDGSFQCIQIGLPRTSSLTGG